jgi:hypothetical protein
MSPATVDFIFPKEQRERARGSRCDETFVSDCAMRATKDEIKKDSDKGRKERKNQEQVMRKER